MLNRWVGIAAFACMLSANTALFIRDILPVWFAGEAPKSEFLTKRPNEPWRRQYAILDRKGARRGTSWSIVGYGGDLITLRTRTALGRMDIAPGVITPEVMIESSLVFKPQGTLDSLKVFVHGLPVDIRMDGEAQVSGEFPCQWQVGENSGTFILSERATRSFGDVIRPFDSLPDLWVGKSWRVELFNPLEQAMPGVSGPGITARSMLVRVVGEEQMLHRGERVTAFRVEADNLRAWVAPDGRILRQEVKLPLFEVLTLVDEPYDGETTRRSPVSFDVQP